MSTKTILNKIFKEDLTQSGMFHADEKPTNLFLVADKDKIKNPYIRVALEQAERYEADAVFFRVFSNDAIRPPVPQVFIYHDTGLSSDRDRYALIHSRLWSAGIVPLIFIFSAGQIKVLNCRQAPKLNEATKKPVYTPFSKLDDLINVEHAIILDEIASGTLWEDPRFKNDFCLEETAYYKLLIHLKAFRVQLVEQNILTEPVANRLLVMAILVKYLNDRKDSNGNGVFPNGFICRFSDADSDDLDLLFRKQGGCVKLFDSLGKHFNGRIFVLSDDERTELGKADLELVADFIKGDYDPATKQGILWPLYSFEDLPIELISNIYEEFLAKKEKKDNKGVVYTPPGLVSFLLDQCLPLNAKTLNWKIFDPACGSGIFLVGAFERLVHCWRIANGWKQPTHLDLKNILKNSIFGCDDKPEAILITVFSLCVALCSKLDPLVIWKELKFDDLREQNLQVKDFFEIVESEQFNGHFDLVIGNPPFESKLTTDAAKRIETKRSKERPKLPDNQLSILFLEQSFHLMHEGSQICMIQPAGPLLYNRKAHSFRDSLFGNFNIDRVFDFTALEGVLFSKAQVAATAIIGSMSSMLTDKILHITFRRTKATKENLVFEIDPYDFHWVNRSFLSKNKFVWKVNLLGGGRLHRLVERLFAGVQTLETYLKEKKNDGWQFGEGYNVGSGSYLNRLPNTQELSGLPSSKLKEQFKLKNPPKTAQWITGNLNVPPEALTKNGIDWGAVKTCDDMFFEGPRDKNQDIFSPPHLLIREIADRTSIPAVFSDEYLVFSKQIIGIHAPDHDKQELKKLAMFLNDSGVSSFLATILSGRILVSRATSFLKEDIFSLPYIEHENGASLNDWESALVDDINEFLIDFRRKGEKAKVFKKANSEVLKSFGDMYCAALNDIYKNFQPLQPLYFGPFIYYPFCYGDAPEIDLPDSDEVKNHLEQLLHRQIGARLFTNRVLRLYEQNVVIMVKPNQTRYWLRSIALRDADETLIDLLGQGY